VPTTEILRLATGDGLKDFMLCVFWVVVEAMPSNKKHGAGGFILFLKIGARLELCFFSSSICGQGGEGGKGGWV